MIKTGYNIYIIETTEVMMRRFRKRKNTTIVNLSEKELKAIEKNFDPNLAEKYMK